MKPFVYADYEEALRDPAMIADLQRRFVGRFAGVGRVLDVGSGRGIFLGLLRAAGIAGIGVDRDPNLVRQARAEGLEVFEADMFDFLATTRERFGGVFCSHVIEHLPFERVLTLIESIAGRLEPNGVFVAVFPNPESIRMQLSGFWKDPEHVRFYHPELVGAVCAHFGLTVVGGSSEDPEPHRLEVPWLGGAHLEGCRVAAPLGASTAPTVETKTVPSPAGRMTAEGSPSELAGQAEGDSSTPEPVRRGRAARWLVTQLDAYYPRTKFVRNLLIALRDELLLALQREIVGVRTAIDRIIDLQERTLAGLGDLNRSIERFNTELEAGIERFNHRLGPTLDALNTMWAAPDEAVLVCRKAAVSTAEEES